ncbi:MAG: Asp-tRNA(Asn)/Glu-tRNA(Gln) amidotransferase subunit GatB, partial [Planctomycetes bacterium]|nr:Asp-tRNA(Asn)/Glu-tRNA(Gln) amidotransferase subunit GatB [Planctomycetota bacterium]
MASNEAAKSSRNPKWEPVIGLEVHVQLNTRSKMFCRCENRFGAEPNSLTCPVCLGHPGTLPAINRTAVEHTILAGLAFGSEIAPYTKFDRKNYFYPDLPKNYQISQYDLPICSGGQVRFRVSGETRTAGLVRIHLEEDAGKNIHAEGLPESWVDLNRAGVPLLEIVSCPDLRTPEEAAAYLKTLRLTMLYLGISDCNMEEGSLRCDCNVSIRPRGSTQLDTRTELKNINSFTFVMNALEYEIGRQIQIRESGKELVQETRLYDSARNETRSLRGKEEAHDYRYFPEPDLVPMRIDEKWLDSLRAKLPKLPGEMLEHFMEDYGLPFYDSDVLIQDPEVADYFERCVKLYPQPKMISNWIINDLFQEMNERQLRAWELNLAPERLVELVEAVEKKMVSVANAREVFKRLIGSARTAQQVIEDMGVG